MFSFFYLLVWIPCSVPSAHCLLFFYLCVSCVLFSPIFFCSLCSRSIHVLCVLPNLNISMTHVFLVVHGFPITLCYMCSLWSLWFVYTSNPVVQGVSYDLFYFILSLYFLPSMYSFTRTHWIMNGFYFLYFFLSFLFWLASHYHLDSITTLITDPLYADFTPLPIPPFLWQN